MRLLLLLALVACGPLDEGGDAVGIFRNRPGGRPVAQGVSVSQSSTIVTTEDELRVAVARVGAVEANGVGALGLRGRRVTLGATFPIFSTVEITAPGLVLDALGGLALLAGEGFSGPALKVNAENVSVKDIGFVDAEGAFSAPILLGPYANSARLDDLKGFNASGVLLLAPDAVSDVFVRGCLQTAPSTGITVLTLSGQRWRVIGNIFPVGAVVADLAGTAGSNTISLNSIDDGEVDTSAGLGGNTVVGNSSNVTITGGAGDAAAGNS